MSDTYDALGNGDLTPEQLDGMDLWDRDVMLDDHHRAVGAMLVRRAVAEIRRRRSQPALTADEVREVVRGACVSADYRSPAGIIASRVSDQLAGRSISADLHAIVGAAAMETLSDATNEACMRVADRAVEKLGKAPVAQPALAADEVRDVVRDIAREEMCEFDSIAGHYLDQRAEEIADRVAEKLAGRSVSADTAAADLAAKLAEAREDRDACANRLAAAQAECDRLRLDITLASRQRDEAREDRDRLRGLLDDARAKVESADAFENSARYWKDAAERMQAERNEWRAAFEALQTVAMDAQGQLIKERDAARADVEQLRASQSNFTEVELKAQRDALFAMDVQRRTAIRALLATEPAVSEERIMDVDALLERAKGWDGALTKIQHDEKRASLNALVDRIPQLLTAARQLHALRSALRQLIGPSHQQTTWTVSESRITALRWAVDSLRGRSANYQRDGRAATELAAMLAEVTP